jgi:hypothetical protein
MITRRIRSKIMRWARLREGMRETEREREREEMHIEFGKRPLGRFKHT